MGIEDCPHCQRNIDSNPKYFRQINLSEIKKINYSTYKVYSYLQNPLERTKLKMSAILNNNFSSKKIFKSLFGEYRNKHSNIRGNNPLNNSLLIDYLLFITTEMDNRYDIRDYIIPLLKKFLKKRRRTKIVEDVERASASLSFSDEFCLKCHRRIVKKTSKKDEFEYTEEILLSDLSYNCSIKIYHYLKEPLEKIITRFTSILLDNFKTKEIYNSLFGKYRRGQEFRFNTSLILDFFIFMIESQDNEKERQEFIIPAISRFLKMRENTEIINDM